MRLHNASINHFDKTIAEHVKHVSILLNKHIRLSDSIISEIQTNSVSMLSFYCMINSNQIKTLENVALL